MKRDKHSHIHTDGHRDSMIESAQWADSMKKNMRDNYVDQITCFPCGLKKIMIDSSVHICHQTKPDAVAGY